MNPRTLAARAKAGDDAALEALVELVWPRLRAWALVELGDPATADDACQEALVRLLRQLPRLDVSRPLEGWLRVVVRNWCRDHRRREGRAAGLPTPEAAAPGDPERALDLSRGARSVAEAFGALTPRQRQAWDLIDRQGLPTADAAAELGVTPSTVRVLVHQARRALRASLEDGESLKSWLRER